jgi:23S rRNA pseudouridine2605 synthase
VRLNKYLADRGVGSRRKCDRLIEEGRVSLNGRVVNEVGSKVEEGDRVSVDGRALGGKERTVYFVLNKPVGVITTLDDPEGRRTIRELLPRGARVYPVGRLDADTSGLLLLTNDGELAHKLMHPRYGVPKVYRVRLGQEPRADQLRRLASGVRFDPLHKDLVSAPARVRRIDPGFDAIMIEMIVHEGRFRQVRRMCEAVGLEVTGLHRVGYGPLSLGPLARGMFRELSEDEVARLKAMSARAGGSGPARAGAERARADRRLERAAGAGRPATRERPAAAARPSAPKPVPAPRSAAGDDEAEIVETWLPGGGFLEPDPDEGESDLAPGEGAPVPAWPVRPAGRRGDAAWEAEAGSPPAAPRSAQRAERPRAERPRAERPRAATGRPARGERTGGGARAGRPRAVPERRDGFARKRDPFARGERPRGGGPRSDRTGREALAPPSGAPRGGRFASRPARPERGGFSPRAGRAGRDGPRQESFVPRGGRPAGRPGSRPRPGGAPRGGPAARYGAGTNDRARGRGATPRPGSGGRRDPGRTGPGSRPARAEGRPAGNSTRRGDVRGRARPAGGPKRGRRPVASRGPGATLRPRGKKSSRRKER